MTVSLSNKRSPLLSGEYGSFVRKLKELDTRLTELRKQSEEAVAHCGRVIAGLTDGDPEVAMREAIRLRELCAATEAAIDEVKKEQALCGVPNDRYRVVHAS